MAKATYHLSNDDLSGLVSTSDILMKRFKHSLPRGTQIEASDYVKIGDLEMPRTIKIFTKRAYEFPETKLDGLYRKIR